jgi:hypothetical protein
MRGEKELTLVFDENSNSYHRGLCFYGVDGFDRLSGRALRVCLGVHDVQRRDADVSSLEFLYCDD